MVASTSMEGLLLCLSNSRNLIKYLLREMLRPISLDQVVSSCGGTPASVSSGGKANRVRSLLSASSLVFSLESPALEWLVVVAVVLVVPDPWRLKRVDRALFIWREICVNNGRSRNLMGL